MRWYLAIDEAGAAGQTGLDAKTAVMSARALGGLEPYLLYYGARNDFTAWMTRQGVNIIDVAPSFLDTIRDAQAQGAYKPHSVGHWLRVAIPHVETAREHVLYTDCDVIFLRRVDWAAMRPKVFAAAPEFRKDNWNYFNAGVMVLNVPQMRRTYEMFEALIRGRIRGGAHPYYDDELALNEAYRGFWDRLDPRLNWKPYWGFSAAAGLVHFHGPKLDAIESIAAGAWTADNPTADVLFKILTAHKPAYQTWLAALADRLQISDPAMSIRMTAAAAALQRLTVPAGLDLSFLDFQMFPED
jgi:hypothetical protein